MTERGLRPLQHPVQRRPVDGDQHARDRVAPLVGDAPADPVAHQHRDQRHRQPGRRRHRIGLGEGQRAEQPPLLRLQREHRDEGQRDDQQREEQRRPDLDRGVGDHLPALVAVEFLPRMRVLPSLDLLVRVLDHHHRGVDHRADGDGDAAQRHDVGVDALPAHHQEGEHHAQRQRDDGHRRRAQVPQEEHADQRDDDELLEQLERQVVDRALDQRAAVVGGDDLHALRQARLQLGQARLHRLDRRLRVLARAQHDHAAGHLALAVELGDAAAHLRAHLQRGDITQPHGDAAARGQRDVAEVVQRLQVAAGAHHVFDFGQFEHRAAALLVAGQQRAAHLLVGDAVGDQLVRIEHHLVLAHHAADAGDLGHVGQALQFVLQEPVLQRAQLRQVVASRAIDQRVLEDPADAGGIGAERGLRAGRQPALHLVQVLEHARARPVQVGAVLEQHVDEAVAEEREAAHRLRAGHRHHRRRQRVGHLVLDDLRRLAGPAGADDDLHVAQVGQRIHRRRAQAPESRCGEEGRRQQHQEAVGHRPADQRGDHRVLRSPRRPAAVVAMAVMR